jgi:uncharacterized membrane protein YfcA
MIGSPGSDISSRNEFRAWQRSWQYWIVAIAAGLVGAAVGFRIHALLPARAISLWLRFVIVIALWAGAGYAADRIIERVGKPLTVRQRLCCSTAIYWLCGICIVEAVNG